MLRIFFKPSKFEVIENASKSMSTVPGKFFHTSAAHCNFFERNRRMGYPSVSDYEEEVLNPLQRIYKGCFQFIEESKKLGAEMKDVVMRGPEFIIPPNEIDVQWKFNGTSESLDKWVITCDSDFNLGYSKASLSLSSAGTGVFSGSVDTRVPKDGKQTHAGFCNIRTIKRRGAFRIPKFYDWGRYNHLILRVRGDGRTYMLNIHLKTFFDIMWSDIHSFPLYTRGGPYWQFVKIPFSKFLLSNRARVQDNQCPLRLWEVEALGITVADVPGPFKLEIDYIGVENDPKHDEEFAYEMYKPPHPYYI